MDRINFGSFSSIEAEVINDLSLTFIYMTILRIKPITH